jgi:adenosine deaminase
MDLYTFLKRLPKVSLHVHLAGSVQPSTLVALASKNGVVLPAYREPEDLPSATGAESGRRRSTRSSPSSQLDAIVEDKA